MKKIFFIILVSFAYNAFAQVGIGTNSPNNSAMLEVSATNKGFLLPRMTSAQRIAIPSPVSGLQVYDSDTNAIWYYNGSFWVNTQAMASVGDVKSGMQSADHSGWIKLDGRAVSTLTATQKTAAATLGFTTSLPNASSAYLAQNSTTLGSLSGSNDITLTQANLPSVNFTGTAASAGTHSHTVDPVSTTTSTDGWHSHSGTVSGSGWNAGGSYVGGFDAGPFVLNQQILTINGAGNHTHTVDIPSTTSSSSGAHTHTVSVSSGGSASPVTVSPRTLSVNMFIYLGN